MSKSRSLRLIALALVFSASLMVVERTSAQAQSLCRAESLLCAQPVTNEPTLDAVVSLGEESLMLSSTGLPFSSGKLVAYFTNPVTGTVDLYDQAVTYDINGQWSQDFPLSMFAGIPQVVIDFGIVQTDGVVDGPVKYSKTFRFESKVFSAGDPSAPIAGSGTINTTYPWNNGPRPGTVSWASLALSGGAVQFCSCAPHGVEGVIPVH